MSVLTNIDRPDSPIISDIRLESFPNPMRTGTTVAYELPEAATVSLKVYDPAGRLVRTIEESNSRPAGRYTDTWDGRDLEGRPVSAGVYFYRLEAGARTVTRKLVIVQ